MSDARIAAYALESWFHLLRFITCRYRKRERTLSVTRIAISNDRGSFADRQLDAIGEAVSETETK